MREIALSQGYVALVDDDDYERINQWKWRVLIKPHTCYAVRHSAGGRWKMVSMHREILGISLPVLTDHRNGNGLDNRRSNLRACSCQENNQNSRSRLGSTSNFKGVSWNKWNQRWKAQIQVDRRTRFLGYFAVEAEAAEAYKTAATLLFGAFAAGARGDKPQEWASGW